MKNVLVFGSFDIIHPGHLFFLRQARRHGGILTVVLARDATIERVKGKKPLYGEKTRKAHLEQLNLVDRVILGRLEETDFYSVLKDANPDIICVGYDQKKFVDRLPEALKSLKLDVPIIRIAAYKEHKYKSSKLKEKMA